MTAVTMTGIARRYFPDLLKNAVAADSVKEWQPDRQVITSTKDDFHFPQVQECIRQHAHAVVTYAIVRIFDEDSLSIELQFVGADEARAFDKAHQRVRLHKPKTGAKGPVKKLFKHRMYILPDGREFLMWGKWDQSRRIGKVIATRNPDGTGTLANEIVDEEVLRKCRLVPRGEEPWGIGAKKARG